MPDATVSATRIIHAPAARVYSIIADYRVHHPRIVLLELGANDGLRGLPLDVTRSNLDRMISLLQEQHIAVLLIGLRMPPNYGERYTTGFTDMYRELAASHHIAWIPFLLENVALKSELMQADGLHPNELGQPLLLDNVWPTLVPLLRSAAHEKPH